MITDDKFRLLMWKKNGVNLMNQFWFYRNENKPMLLWHVPEYNL